MKFEKDIRFFLDQYIFDNMKDCVKGAKPNEACGLIFGEIKEVNVGDGFQYHYVSKKFNCIESDRKSPVAFLIDNIEKLNELFLEASQKHNLRLISVFHSHPGGSYPSGVDERNMKFLDDCGNRAFKNQIWTIMDASKYNLNGFIYFNRKLLQVEVQLIKNEK
jgi:proteasome lid subunit RPN8/RPN11